MGVDIYLGYTVTREDGEKVTDRFCEKTPVERLLPFLQAASSEWIAEEELDVYLAVYSLSMKYWEENREAHWFEANQLLAQSTIGSLLNWGSAKPLFREGIIISDGSCGSTDNRELIERVVEWLGLRKDCAALVETVYWC